MRLFEKKVTPELEMKLLRCYNDDLTIAETVRRTPEICKTTIRRYFRKFQKNPIYLKAVTRTEKQDHTQLTNMVDNELAKENFCFNMLKKIEKHIDFELLEGDTIVKLAQVCLKTINDTTHNKIEMLKNNQTAAILQKATFNQGLKVKSNLGGDGETPDCFKNQFTIEVI
ncbi:MAG: hypothetical protein LBV51_00020 [Acholeplasmatales bacterium]|jgi:hypothetical protein|nr:hypothetical protein [Acholeplasmatales bacterium]